MKKRVFLWGGVCVVALNIFQIHCFNNIYSNLSYDARPSYLGIVCFVVLCLITYILGGYVLKRKNKSLYLGFIVMNMLLKMIIAVIILLVSKFIFLAVSKSILLSFIIVYITFTIYEVSFMLRQNKDAMALNA